MTDIKMANGSPHSTFQHKCWAFEIEIHDPPTCPLGSDFVQARYLVHGYEDVLWTDDLDQAIAFLRESCERVVRPIDD